MLRKLPTAHTLYPASKAAVMQACGINCLSRRGAWLPKCASSLSVRSLPSRRSALAVRASAAVMAPHPDVASQTPPLQSGPPTSPSLQAHENALREAMLNGTAIKPADADRKHFKLHWSVDFWRDFRVPDAITSDDASVASKVRLLAQKGREAGVWASPQSAAYWTYHIGRSGLLALQGVAGLFAAEGTAQATQTPNSERTGMRFGNVTKFGGSTLYEAMAMFWQDYRNITGGSYKLPWDMTTRGHRQWNPVHMLSAFGTFVREAASTLDRRHRGSPDAVWLKSPLYPEYYLNTFHYQTDGWLSEHSAKVYELSTETLFVGRQDAMQRQTLVPLSQHLRGLAANAGPPSVLEVACGTGRFATFLKDNHPEAQITALDLSPYYLAEARRNLDDWKRLRDKDNAAPLDRFLQAAAEKIPAPDNSFDAVTCIYLFHELPPDVRTKVAQELARVVKPGGMVVVTDSAQMGDRPLWDKTMGGFGNFNEPFYRTYITTDLGALFRNAGLQPDTKVMASSSKVLSFIKPTV